jgi:hypothetical protein
MDHFDKPHTSPVPLECALAAMATASSAIASEAGAERNRIGVVAR